MTTVSCQPSADDLIALWQLVTQHQGDLAPLDQWLLAHPCDALALAAALPLAAPRWLAAHPADRPLALRAMATVGNAMVLRHGNRAAQIELAIAIYSWVLKELSATTNSVDWATTLNNLATAYRHRQVGDPAANLDWAIQLYGQALTVPLPPTQAVALAGLAATYRDRINGDPGDNLEQAIAAYEQALATIPRRTQPLAWAAIANHLAAAYGDRQTDRLQAIDSAIATYRRGLVDLQLCAS